ncbi:bacillithiol system redox-active protein YtxJ [Calidifontibacillus erzurumensis]|uniref:Bacillithiol system redox-active protein YtxJ n=1 Tax=Calidifontibacillus erzurumensis TaxID=2741433 RepID=A0A8J8KBR8_9BACI|nr:bacillithiol system redox-active protein YtxJ [Calidifontibacillus erzurumensis]NSL51323.1 bacillithiol system redox-active protein YtxJ [Calidifontibacillus erzurumensis]
MGKQKISTIEEFTEILKNNDKFLLIKHSLTCPISSNAFNEYEKFTESTDLPTYFLYVQDDRPLSNYIAETFGVKHESPQAILFENQAVKWHASHWKITEASLKEAVEK